MAEIVAYFRTSEGVFQKYKMDQLDFDEAVRPRTISREDGTRVTIKGSDEWSLAPPDGAIIEDKIPMPIVVERQEPVALPSIAIAAVQKPIQRPQPLRHKITDRAS